MTRWIKANIVKSIFNHEISPRLTSECEQHVFDSEFLNGNFIIKTYLISKWGPPIVKILDPDAITHGKAILFSKSNKKEIKRKWCDPEITATLSSQPPLTAKIDEIVKI